ncbi:MAG: MFS transporter [Gammaproteobacteria bacterium]
MGAATTPGHAARAGKTTLAVLALTLALAYGIWYAYSVLLVALLDDFGWSRSTVAGAFSLFAVVHGGCNPLIGMLCDRMAPAAISAVASIVLGVALFACSLVQAPWQLYLAFGGLTAVSVAACGWVPAVVQVQRRFPHRLGFAIGIVSSGVGVGMFVVVPLCQALIEAAGWRFAFRALGVLAWVIILPSALYLLRGTPRTAVPRAAVATDAATQTAAGALAPRSITLREAARTLPFWLIVAAFFFGSLCSQTLQVHQVAFLVDHGIAALAAASVVGVVGLASIVGKTGGGWLSDRVERELVYVAGVAVLVASVFALFAVGRHTSQPGAYGFAVLLGIGYSATAALVPAMVSDRFQGRHFGAILGIGLLGSAAGSAFGPWLGGYLFDLTGSYTLPFGIAAASGVVAGVAGWVARVLRVRAARCA